MAGTQLGLHSLGLHSLGLHSLGLRIDHQTIGLFRVLKLIAAYYIVLLIRSRIPLMHHAHRLLAVFHNSSDLNLTHL
jgi:hypothetical protein